MRLGSGLRVLGCGPDRPEPPALSPEPECPAVILRGALILFGGGGVCQKRSESAQGAIRHPLEAFRQLLSSLTDSLRFLRIQEQLVHDRNQFRFAAELTRSLVDVEVRIPLSEGKLLAELPTWSVGVRREYVNAHVRMALRVPPRRVYKLDRFRI